MLPILQKLTSFPSITPADAGCLTWISDFLNNLGFESQIIEFGEGETKTRNLYSEYKVPGSTENFCFLGHVDVVPPGDLSKWNSDPFTLTIKDNIVTGRGVVDMKGSIAAFLAATQEFLEHQKPSHTVSIMLTGDEEGAATNGVQKLLPYLYEKGIKITSAITGEPTSDQRFGDIIKVGRRGSVSFELEVIGKQGHVAYPAKASNPITALAEIISLLKRTNLDDGSEFFDSSNLEFTSISTDNAAGNVIPGSCKAKFNVRFNDHHNASSIIEFVNNTLSLSLGKNNYKLTYSISGESFITQNLEIASILSKAVKDTLGIEPKFSTSGGTSDMRFMIKYCDNIAEFGLLNSTAHHINEGCKLEEIEQLKEVYKLLLTDVSVH